MPADWKSYSNHDFGFALQYPRNFTACAGGLDYCEVSPSSYVLVCSDEVVDCFVYTSREYEGTNFEGAALSVNVLRDRQTEQDCNKFHIGPNPVKTKIINGILFRYGMTGGANLGHWGGGPTYRTFCNQACFELAANTSGTNFANFDPGTIKEFNGPKLVNEFDAMLSTFKFISPVADGPAWRVYHNSDVGGAFEYPDADTVVRSIEYSPERESSNEITDSLFFSDNGLNYFVATIVGSKKDALDAWLTSSGYPDLSKAQELRHSKLFKEYRAGDYLYVYGKVHCISLGFHISSIVWSPHQTKWSSATLSIASNHTRWWPSSRICLQWRSKGWRRLAIIRKAQPETSL